MRYEDENIWLTQKMMATLYDVDVRTINEHIKKIYSDLELEEDSTIRNFRIVQTEGSRQVTRDTKHYNLQMIIAVGFKVNSERAVQFRKWVNQIAKDYTIKGWVMDDERLKRGTYLTEKYFDERLERIREIRASERKFYQKITDLYATAIDYDKNAATTRRFYATVQNMLHEAEAHHISVILTKSISRFGRDTVDTLEALRRLKAAGTRVIFDEEGLDTDEVDDELLISVAESFAQSENESRSMNIRIGLRNHALNGSSGNYRKRLYGYVKDDDGNLVIEPTQAQVVRDIYRWYIDGASIETLSLLIRLRLLRT